MTEPKYRVGDRVMVRGKVVVIDDTLIDCIELVRSGSTISYFDGKKSLYVGPDCYLYGVEGSDRLIPCRFIFPYQAPGQSFDQIMTAIKNNQPHELTEPA